MKQMMLFLLSMMSITSRASQASFKIHPDPEAKSEELKKAGQLITANLIEEIAKINSKNIAAVIEVHLHDTTGKTIEITKKLKVVDNEEISFTEKFFGYKNGRRLTAEERK